MKSIMTKVLLLIILSNLLPASLLASPPPKLVNALSKMNRAHDRVSLTNLLGGLFLSDAQVARLIPLAKAAEEVNEKYSEEGLKLAREATRSYDNLVTENVNHPNLLKSERQQEAQDLHNSFKELKSEYNQELLKLQQSATAILTPSQQRIVSTFKACIVPPRSLKDPTLVGQAQSTGEVSKVINVLRKAPKDLYENHKGKIADLGLAHVEKKNGLLRPEAKKALKEQLIATVDELRSMSDEDYALQSQEKIDGLLPFDKEHPKDLSKWSPSPVGQFFLADGAFEILRKWQGARKESKLTDNGAAQKAALALRQEEAKKKFQNLVKLGSIAYRALAQKGQVPHWLKEVRQDVEALAKEKKFNEAAEEIDKALTKLEEERGGQDDLIIRGLNIRRLIKGKGLSFAARNKKLDLFGLASKLENFQYLVKAGNLERAQVEGKELQTLIERFKD